MGSYGMLNPYIEDLRNQKKLQPMWASGCRHPSQSPISSHWYPDHGPAGLSACVPFSPPPPLVSGLCVVSRPVSWRCLGRDPGPVSAGLLACVLAWPPWWCPGRCPSSGRAGASRLVSVCMCMSVTNRDVVVLKAETCFSMRVSARDGVCLCMGHPLIHGQQHPILPPSPPTPVSPEGWWYRDVLAIEFTSGVAFV